MRLADTNFLLALLIPERALQHEAALRTLEAIQAEGEYLSVGELVLGEACWVLEKSYRWPRASVAAILGAVLQAPEVRAWNPEEARQALVLMQKRPQLSLADCLLVVRSARSGAPVETFDLGLLRVLEGS